MTEPNICQADYTPHACVKCKIVRKGLETHGFADVAVDLNCLYDEIMKNEEIGEINKSDTGEVIASVMKQLGHTGQIDSIILKLFDKQMTEFLQNNSDVLKIWKGLKRRL